MKAIDILRLFFVVITSFLIAPLPGHAQKRITPADYEHWGKLSNGEISGEGNWVSFLMRYQSGNDTLFVRHSKEKKTFAFPKARGGKFAGERWFAYKGADTLFLQDLIHDKLYKYPTVSEFLFSGNGEHLLMVNSADSQRLTMVTMKGLKMQVIDKVQVWKADKKLEQIAFVSANDSASVLYVIPFNASGSAKEITRLNGMSINIMAWQDENSSVAFAAAPMTLKDTVTDVFCYRFKDNRIFRFSATHSDFPKNKALQVRYYNDLFFSADGRQVFFSIATPVNDPVTIAKPFEVWNSKDKRILSDRRFTGPLELWPGLGRWDLESGTFFDVTGNYATHYFLDPMQKFAVISHMESCEPDFGSIPRRDFYMVNLSTRKKDLLFGCLSPEASMMHFSPDGSMLACFIDKDWYVYDTSTLDKTCITCTIQREFHDNENDNIALRMPYGFGGWSKASGLVIYDRNDIWEFFTGKNGARRLTSGAEKELVLRLAQPAQESKYIDLGKEVLLQVLSMDKSRQGYCQWSQMKNVKGNFLLADKLEGQLAISSKTGAYSYVDQKFNVPPAIVIKSNGSGHRLLFQSNPHYKNYLSGKAERFSYSVAGKKLNGLLYYPVGYDPALRYPMVVHIYERQASNLNVYMNPGAYGTGGFNLANYTQQGYFVLLPDIEFVIGEPGESALACVMSAVTKVLSFAPVKKNAMGLIGASLGGFLTSYIMTRTDIFTAAVSGAAPADFISSYLGLSNSSRKEEFWRHEEDQMRLGGSFFDHKERYLSNSPALNAEKIITPLLSWTGLSDGQVSPLQSMELHLAMRRLHKTHILLQYPDEGHGILKPAAQLDLDGKIMEWFEYYLKQGPQPMWMQPR